MEMEEISMRHLLASRSQIHCSACSAARSHRPEFRESIGSDESAWPRGEENWTVRAAPISSIDIIRLCHIQSLGISDIIRGPSYQIVPGSRMGKDILVRDVPLAVDSWIGRESKQACVTKREFVLKLLERAHDDQQIPLFSAVAPRARTSPWIPRVPFKFIDLFAGIGGFRIALEKLGGRCVFSCERDQYSQKTYKTWFGDTPHKDILDLKADQIPDHDVLAAGFPCQPFSIAGVSKKNSLGRAHGFKCSTQGTLFFYLETLIGLKRPPVVFLENVKNLKSHDHGRTWSTIQDRLDGLRYHVFPEVIDAAGWVPQHRERIYIVCFDRDQFKQRPDFRFPRPSGKKARLADILETSPDPKYTLTPHLWNYLQEYAKKHKEKGNGFGFSLADPNGVSRTLSARYYKDGSEILIAQGEGRPPRRLTPRECARLMGFDQYFQDNIVVSDTQAYRQFGNAVVPRVVEAVGEQIVATLVEEWNSGETCLLKGRNGTIPAHNLRSKPS